MQIKSILTSAIALTLLSGCDLVDSITDMVRAQTAEMTIILPPEVKLQIDENQIAYVVGYDKCPKNSGERLAHSDNCILIETNTAETLVTLTSLSGKSWDEKWKISRIGDAIKLIRPNGFEVRETTK